MPGVTEEFHATIDQPSLSRILQYACSKVQNENHNRTWYIYIGFSCLKGSEREPKDWPISPRPDKGP